MSDNLELEQTRNNANAPDDEIELIDLLRVLWKWKYMIAGGTIFLAIVALIISLNMTRIYQVDMIIEPGLLAIINGAEGQNRRVYIDSPDKVKALIDAGSFENQILDNLKKEYTENDIPKKIKFITRLPKDSNVLSISYDTSNAKQGLKILNYLSKFLEEKYEGLIKYYHREFDGQIQLKTSKINELSNKISKLTNEIANVEVEYDNKIQTNKGKVDKLENHILKIQNDISSTEVDYLSRLNQNNSKKKKISYQILQVKNDISNIQADMDAEIKRIANKISSIMATEKAKNSQIKNLQNRTEDIQDEYIRVNKNTNYLIEERNRLLADKTNGDNVLSSVIYINTIQQNIGYLNDLKSRVNNIQNQIYQESADIENLESQIKDQEAQRENLIKQTENKIDNQKSQIANLENDIHDIDQENEIIEKEKVFKIDNLKYQINNSGSDKDKTLSENENLKKQIKFEIGKLNSQVNDLEAQKRYALEEIKNIEFKKDNVQNIQTIKLPSSDGNPISPKIFWNVLISSIAGLMVMIVFSFFLSYIKGEIVNNKN